MFSTHAPKNPSYFHNAIPFCYPNNSKAGEYANSTGAFLSFITLTNEGLLDDRHARLRQKQRSLHQQTATPPQFIFIDQGKYQMQLLVTGTQTGDLFNLTHLPSTTYSR